MGIDAVALLRISGLDAPRTRVGTEHYVEHRGEPALDMPAPTGSSGDAAYLEHMHAAFSGEGSRRAARDRSTRSELRSQSWIPAAQTSSASRPRAPHGEPLGASVDAMPCASAMDGTPSRVRACDGPRHEVLMSSVRVHAHLDQALASRTRMGAHPFAHEARRARSVVVLPTRARAEPLPPLVRIVVFERAGLMRRAPQRRVARAPL
jgi:hypothetical protein